MEIESGKDCRRDSLRIMLGICCGCGAGCWPAYLRIRFWMGCGMDAIGEMAVMELVNYGDCLHMDT